MSLDLQKLSYNLNAVFFGCYGLTIGYLVFRSAFLPRILGVPLAVGRMCYLTHSFADFIASAFAATLVPYIQMPSGIAELALSLWLLVIAVNVQCWREQAAQGAGQTQAPGLA